MSLIFFIEYLDLLKVKDTLPMHVAWAGNQTKWYKGGVDRLSDSQVTLVDSQRWLIRPICHRTRETGRTTLEQKTLGGVKEWFVNCLSFHLLQF